MLIISKGGFQFMKKFKLVKTAAALALGASVVTAAVVPGATDASAASKYKVSNGKLLNAKTGKAVKGYVVYKSKLYYNGKVKKGYKTVGTGKSIKLYYNGTLKKGYKTARDNKLLFFNGKLKKGYKTALSGEYLYKDGFLNKGYKVYGDVDKSPVLYYNGKLKSGYKTANNGTLLFYNGKLKAGYKTAKGGTVLYKEGRLTKGLVEFDGKFYNDSKLANGEVDGTFYKDGVAVVALEGVKAINSTTVEVTFKDAVKADDAKASRYKIEGLDIKNAAVKQTNDKVVVLTTSAQEAGKTYTLEIDGVKAKTFQSAASTVVPTAISASLINPYQTSQQAVIGKEVTVKASVTVPEGQSKAGIPVTFNIDSKTDSANGNFGEDKKVEVFTDANGVASYTYTQYGTIAGYDEITAYPTGTPGLRTVTYVYWGVQAHQLTVVDVTKEITLANKGTKQYKVTGEANTTYKVAFAENYEVTPDKVNHKATIIGDNGTPVTPYQTTIAGKADASSVAYVTTNAKGEGTFTVSGSNTSVTPVVFEDDQVRASQAGYDRLNPEELQATASTVKFENIQTVALTNEAKGVQRAAAKTAKGDGGRTYEATLKTNDGKTTAPAGTTVYLTIADEADKAAAIKGNLHVYNAAGTEVIANANGIYSLSTDKNGVVEYTITSDVKNNYATPVVFLDNGSSNTLKLDANDTQAAAQLTYFGDEKVEKATVKYYTSSTFADDTEISKAQALASEGKVYVEYQTIDQNGFDYAPETDGLVTFNFTTTFGDVTVKKLNGEVVATQPVIGNTNGVAKFTTNNGKIQFSIESTKPSTINITTNSSTISSEPTVFTFTGVGAKTLTDTVTAVNNAANTDAAIKAALTGYSKFDELTLDQKTAVVESVKAEAAKGSITGTQITNAIKVAVANAKVANVKTAVEGVSFTEDTSKTAAQNIAALQTLVNAANTDADVTATAKEETGKYVVELKATDATTVTVQIANITTSAATVAANADIATAKGLLANNITLAAADTNLLTVLNAVTGMSATGVTLEVTNVTGATNAAIVKSSGATNGDITNPSLSATPAQADEVLTVTVKITKANGTAVTKDIQVTVPAK